MVFTPNSQGCRPFTANQQLRETVQCGIDLGVAQCFIDEKLLDKTLHDIHVRFEKVADLGVSRCHDRPEWKKTVPPLHRPLPAPRGPTSSTPVGIFPPSLANCFGSFKNSTFSSRFDLCLFDTGNISEKKSAIVLRWQASLCCD